MTAPPPLKRSKVSPFSLHSYYGRYVVFKIWSKDRDDFILSRNEYIECKHTKPGAIVFLLSKLGIYGDDNDFTYDGDYVEIYITGRHLGRPSEHSMFQMYLFLCLYGEICIDFQLNSPSKTNDINYLDALKKVKKWFLEYLQKKKAYIPELDMGQDKEGYYFRTKEEGFSMYRRSLESEMQLPPNYSVEAVLHLGDGEQPYPFK